MNRVCELEGIKRLNRGVKWNFRNFKICTKKSVQQPPSHKIKPKIIATMMTFRYRLQPRSDTFFGVFTAIKLSHNYNFILRRNLFLSHWKFAFADVR